MATKSIHIDGIGTVKLYKRKGVRHIRLSLYDKGVRVTLPWWVPYQSGIDFLKQKRAWIEQHQEAKKTFTHNDRIGKSHRIVFIGSDNLKPTVRVAHQEVRVFMPTGMDQRSVEVQAVAERGAFKALRKEAEALLPKRLQQLAEEHGFTYTSVRIKRLKSRWGSCNQRKEIVLNSFLMQLPWELIDYVLLHELTHTKILAHGRPFWEEMERHSPNVKQLRKEIKLYRAQILNSEQPYV